MNYDIFNNLPDSSKKVIQDFLANFKNKIAEDIVNYQNVSDAIKKTAEKGIETRVQLHQIDQETEKAATGIIEKSELIMERQNEISKIAKRLRQNSEKEEKNLIPSFENLLLNILEVSKIIKGKTIEESIKDKIKKIERDLIIMTADKIMSHEVVADSIIHQEKIAIQNSDDLFEILNLCQFQDITSQELAKAHTLIKTIIDRLNFVLNAFHIEELQLDHHMKIKPHFEQASYGDKTKEQEEIDALFSSGVKGQDVKEKKREEKEKNKKDYDIFEQIKSEYDEKISKDEEEIHSQKQETVKVPKGPRDVIPKTVEEPPEPIPAPTQEVKAEEKAAPLPAEDLEVFKDIRNEFNNLRKTIQESNKSPDDSSLKMDEEDKKVFNQIKSEFETMKKELKAKKPQEASQEQEKSEDFDLFEQIKNEYDDSKSIEMSQEELEPVTADQDSQTEDESAASDTPASDDEESPEDLFEQLQKEYQNVESSEPASGEEEVKQETTQEEEELLSILDSELEENGEEEEKEEDFDLDDLAKKFEDAGDGDVISQEEIDKILSGG